MFKKRDLILIGIFTVFALAVLLIVPMLREKAPADAKWYLRYQAENGEQVLRPLGEDQQITVDQGDGKVNVIRLSPDGFVMESSTCHNQLCIYQGQVTVDNMDERPLYNMIVCAPHRLVLELITAKEAGQSSSAASQMLDEQISSERVTDEE